MKQLIANLKEYGFEVWILTASPEILYQKFVAEEFGISNIYVVGAKCVIKNGVTTGEIIPPIPQDDGKAHTIETFIKAAPLIVGGNSRGDMDMINESTGLKMVVNPDDETVRGPEDGPMHGHTVKSYWEKEGALIVKCDDVRDPDVKFHTEDWKIRQNKANPK
jgi:phosphoserine phosphatase